MYNYFTLNNLNHHLIISTLALPLNRCGLYPQGTDELLRLAWSTVAREAIIDTLITSSGLQLKLSADSNKIYCRVRAPIKLLELQAHSEMYRWGLSVCECGCASVCVHVCERGVGVDYLLDLLTTLYCPHSPIVRLLLCILFLFSRLMHLYHPFSSFLLFSLPFPLLLTPHFTLPSHTFSHLLHSFLVFNSEVKLTQVPKIFGII